jgi:hypothetical protein
MNYLLVVQVFVRTPTGQISAQINKKLNCRIRENLQPVPGKFYKVQENANFFRDSLKLGSIIKNSHLFRAVSPIANCRVP